MRFNKLKFWFFFIGIFYSLAVWSGLYGFGIDFYGSYGKGNLWHWGSIDKIGFAIASLSVNGHHLGVFFVTFVVFISIFSILRSYFIKNIFLIKGNDMVLFLFLFVLILHTWPVIMANSNAMRQGLMMGFLYLSISNFEQGKRKTSFLQFMLMFVMHKSSVLFGFYLVSSLFSSYLGHVLKKGFLIYSYYFLYGVFSLLFFSLYVIPMYRGDAEASRIIGKDLNGIFIFINFIYLLYYFVFLPKVKKKSVESKLLLWNSMISPIFFFYGLNWQYERINMVLVILYIFSFSSFFSVDLRKLFLFIVFSLFVFFTVWAGMFSALY